MSNRNRIISQSKAIYISPSAIDTGTHGIAPTGDVAFRPTQLDRIDTFSSDVDYAGSRQDVFEFGQRSRISTVRQGETLATVSMGHYLVDGRQEDMIGLQINGFTGGVPVSQIISGMMTANPFADQKNIYELTVPDGVDAYGYADKAAFEAAATGFVVRSYGNGTLTSYSANFSVGEIPRADYEFECNNVVTTTGDVTILNNPSINKETALPLTGVYSLVRPTLNLDNANTIGVLRNGDITLTIGSATKAEGGVDYATMKIQSFGIEVPLGRQALEELGKEQPYAKPLENQLVSNISINAIVADMKAGSLASILTGCAGDEGIAMTVTVLNPCDGSTGLIYNIQDAVLDTEGFSLGLDDNQTVDLAFSVTLGGATSTGAGIYCYGSALNASYNSSTGYHDRFNTGGQF